MSDLSMQHMLAEYEERSPAPQFLSGFFKSPPRNFHNTEFVEIDIKRSTEKVAIVVVDVTTGARVNDAELFTNKKLKPPVFKEAGAISAFSLWDRRPGQSPFASPDYRANAAAKSIDIGVLLADKIRRAVEMMASQVLQTGVITLTDSNGVALYTLDYQQKDNHRANAATTWAADGSTGTPLADLQALADLIRIHGKRRPNVLVFGATALQRFFKNDEVVAELDNRRKIRGEFVRPQRPMADDMAKYHGEIAIGNDIFEIWLYNGHYEDPVTGLATDYVGTNNVIMLSDSARLDLTYGGIPLIQPEARALQFLPQQMRLPARQLGLTLNSYIAKDNTAVMIEAMARPLVIPTAIDTFGVLDINAAT